MMVMIHDDDGHDDHDDIFDDIIDDIIDDDDDDDENHDDDGDDAETVATWCLLSKSLACLASFFSESKACASI